MVSLSYPVRPSGGLPHCVRWSPSRIQDPGKYGQTAGCRQAANIMALRDAVSWATQHHNDFSFNGIATRGAGVASAENAVIDW